MIDRRTFSTALIAGVATSLFRRPSKAEAQPAVSTRNVVLVHGAYADGSSWTEVIGRLQLAGLKATAVQNPLTSLADDVAATRRVLALQDGPTVLVGHSWAGTVISEAGVDPKVSALVYVAARGPGAGGDHAAPAAQIPPPPAKHHRPHPERRRPSRLTGVLPGAKAAVDREGSRATHENRQRHANQGQVHLVTVCLARLEGPVEEEAIAPVHLGDRYQHDEDEPHRRGPD